MTSQTELKACPICNRSARSDGQWITCPINCLPPMSRQTWQRLPRQSDALRGIVEEMQRAVETGAYGSKTIESWVHGWASRLSAIADEMGDAREAGPAEVWVRTTTYHDGKPHNASYVDDEYTTAFTVEAFIEDPGEYSWEHGTPDQFRVHVPVHGAIPPDPTIHCTDCGELLENEGHVLCDGCHGNKCEDNQ